MPSVILTGPPDALGRRVGALLGGAGFTVIQAVPNEPATDLKARAEGAAALVHLADGLQETRDLLDAAGAIGVGQVVLLSSATVYGAWPGNPIPLTEDANVRPNAELDFAVQAAERERLAAEWKLDHPGTSVALLRPAVPVAEDSLGWLAEGLLAAATIRAVGADDPPVQYVHVDDLASAIEIALTGGLDGAFNVAPDGWISGEQLRALAGRPRLSLPEKVAAPLMRLTARFGPLAAHPGLGAYTRHPWVVANDRMRSTGWSPAWTNEEAFVAGHEPLPWAMINPQRRQELALGALGAAVIAACWGGVALLRRHRRRR